VDFTNTRLRGKERTVLQGERIRPFPVWPPLAENERSLIWQRGKLGSENLSPFFLSHFRGALQLIFGVPMTASWPALYHRLGRSAAARQEAYRALFRAALDEDFVDGLRAATRGGWALGDAGFKRQIAKALGRRVAPLRRGHLPRRRQRSV
jgi:hypothetical protein